MKPQTGNVKTHAQMMRSTKPHLTAPKRLATPTPMMEVVMAWVVERGMP